MKFLSRGSGYSVFLTPAETVLVFGRDQRIVLRMKLIGAAHTSRVVGLDELPSKSHYFLGGNANDYGKAIAVDRSGNAYVTGDTNSTNFPTASPLQAVFGGGICSVGGAFPRCEDAFVAKLNPAGSALAYSTYLGGSRDDFGQGIAVDSSGNAYVTGASGSIDFPTASPLQATPSPSGAFVAKLNAAGSALVYSTYFGGSGSQGESGRAIAVDSSGNAYVTGSARSLNLPTANPLQATFGGGEEDAFVAKIGGTTGATPVFTAAGVTNGAGFLAGASPGSIVTIFGTGLTTSLAGIVVADRVPLPTRLAGTSVAVDGVAAPLFAVANVNRQEQINLQVPWELAGKSTANVVIDNSGAANAPVQVSILPAHPGIFTVDGTAGAVLHGTTNQLVTNSSPAARGEAVVIFATGLGPVSPTPATAAAASTSPLSLTSTTPVVTVGGLNAEALFSGLASGFVGLYQLNIRIPANAPSGAVPVVITAGAVSSKTVTLAIN